VRVNRAVLVVVFAAVIVQTVAVGYAWRRGGAIDHFALASVDGGEFTRIASNWVDSFAYSQSPSAPYESDTWRTPGYPLFLAGVMTIAGSSPVVLVVAQQLVAVLSAWLFFVVARRRLGRTAATVASLLWILEPFRAYYSLWLLSLTWFVFVLLAGLWSWDRQGALDRPGRWAVLTGALVGFAVLVRPVAILLPPLVCIGAGWRARRLGVAAMCLAGTVAVLLPWVVRNRVVAGHWGLSHQGGAVLAYFKASEVLLWERGQRRARYDEAVVHEVWDALDASLHARLEADGVALSDDARSTLRWPNLAWGRVEGVNGFVVSDALCSVAWDALRRRPGATVVCGVARMVSILTFPLPLALSPPTTPAALPLTGSFGHERRALGRVLAGLLGAGYAGLVVVAMVRGVRVWRRGGRVGVLTLVVPVLALLVLTTPQMDPRFRVPMMPFLLLLALLPLPRDGAPRREEASRSAV